MPKILYLNETEIYHSVLAETSTYDAKRKSGIVSLWAHGEIFEYEWKLVDEEIVFDNLPLLTALIGRGQGSINMLKTTLKKAISRTSTETAKKEPALALA